MTDADFRLRLATCGALSPFTVMLPDMPQVRMMCSLPKDHEGMHDVNLRWSEPPDNPAPLHDQEAE